MMRTLLWLVPLLVYFVFGYWYTNTAGPLTSDEIESIANQMRESGAPEERIATLRTFMEQDTGRQFIMLNNIDMSENPPDVDGAEPGENADQLMGRYMEHMYPELFKRASHPVYFGRVVFRSMDIVGIKGAENWDQGALMRYRSRRDLVEIATKPVFAGKHDFKIAALDKTIAYPMESVLYLSDLRFLLALLLFAFVSLIDLLLYRR